MALKMKLPMDRSAEQELAARVKRRRSRDRPLQLDSVGRALQFLRGVNSRATFALSSFYLFNGAKSASNQSCLIEGYPGVVLQHTLEFSSIGTMSLCCRKAFDHAANGLTGANFAKSTDETLQSVAEHWATMSKRPTLDALAALHLLRSIFRDCARTDTALFDAEFPLGRRIGLLKQYADRSAAHLSMEEYEFSILDCAHVVAALTVIGEIIRSFDSPETQGDYFNALDEASYNVASQLFPNPSFSTRGPICDF